MEPVSIAIIATTVFGVTASIAVFVRHLLLSRDQRLNEKAQERALEKEALILEKMREKMEGMQRFNAHYSVLKSNKDEIQYLDQKIDGFLEKKFALVKRYSELAVKESSKLIKGDGDEERKEGMSRLRDEIDLEINFYDDQIKNLQSRRAEIWDSHHELQTYLVEQEQTRNKSLDELYHNHTGMLEKIYLRNIDKNEKMAVKAIDSGTSTMSLILQPLKMLLEFLQVLPNISKERAKKEISWREQVGEIEDDINQADNKSVQDDQQALEQSTNWGSEFGEMSEAETEDQAFTA
tara:strand:- start:483 stop:1361 length:879 start_codon:yes stop_codon:yes gene_type:complete